MWFIKVSKGAKIKNRYNQVPHQIKDTNGKVTNSQLKFPQKKYRLGTVSKNILLEDLNMFHVANLTLNSDVDQDT